MIKIYADFNDKTQEGGCWILQYEGVDLGEKASELGLSVGDQIVLYQDEDDFEVTATLDFGLVETMGFSSWVAYPDWSTLNRLPSGSAQAAPGAAPRKVA